MREPGRYVLCIQLVVCVGHHFGNCIRNVSAGVFSFAGDWECYPHDPTVWHVSHFFTFHSNDNDTVTNRFFPFMLLPYYQIS